MYIVDLPVQNGLKKRLKFSSAPDFVRWAESYARANKIPMHKALALRKKG